MGPTSNIVLAVLVLAIVAVVAATAVWWNRGALRRTRNGALLLLGQVLVATLLLAVVNDHEQFYTSWPEVFGITPSGIAVTSYGAPLAGPLPASLLGTGPAGTLDRHLRALRRLQRGRGSMVTDIVLAGRRTGYRFPARLYLPQAYFSAEAAHRTFPVVELFAGGGGGPRSPFASLPLQQAFDRAIAAGTLPPLIAVAPTRNPIRFPDSQCLDDPRGLKVFTYLADDVPAALRTLLRVRPDRGGWVAMGNSSGGYCAANVAVRRPGQFATVVSLSGYFSRPLDGFPMRDPLVGAAARRANSPLDGLLHLRLPMNVIAVSALDDRSAMREIGALVRVLRHRPADHEDIITSRTGGHSSLPWRSTLPAIIGALGNDLRRSGADPTCAAPPTARHHPGPARRVGGTIRAGGANRARGAVRAGGRLRRR